MVGTLRRAVLVSALSVGCAATHDVPPLATVPVAYDVPQPFELIATAPSTVAADTIRVIAGFTVHVSPAASLQPELGDFLVALEVHLADVVRSFPVMARLELRRVGIYLTEHEAHPPVFHTDEGWLREHQMDVALARNIEVPSVRVALDSLRGGGGFGFFLAAGYVVRHGDAAMARVRATYESDSKAKGGTADGSDDAVSYFANLSWRYFGEPDRPHLCAQDRAGCALMHDLWPAERAPDLPLESEVERRLLAGFDVWITKPVAQRKEGLASIDIIGSELTELAPFPNASERLRGTKILVRASTDAADKHAVWFHDGFVDVPDAAAFVAARTYSAHAILHELGHALDAARPDLRTRRDAVYQHAMAEHLYDASAYATVSANEYFAELSKAYLSRARVAGTHAALKTADPMGFALMVEAWGRRH